MLGATLYISEEPCVGCLKLIRGTPIERFVTPRTVWEKERSIDQTPPGESVAQADVWQEGYDAGHEDARAVQPTWPDPTLNPYHEKG
jgi:hypothetical protein